MARMTPERKAYDAFVNGINVMEFSPRTFAYMIARATPRIQQRVWDILKEIAGYYAQHYAEGNVFPENENAMREAFEFTQSLAEREL